MFTLKRKKTEREKFRSKLYFHYKNMGYKALALSMDEVYKYLKNLRGKISDKTIKQVNKIIEERYLKELKKTKKYIKPLIAKYYPSQKPNYRVRKERIGYDLTGIDVSSINLLSQADILWIKNHSTDTKIAKEISKVMQSSIEAGLTGQEIAGVLKVQFAEFAPEAFIQKFGEALYWAQVVNNNVTRTSAIAKINSMVQAEIEYYQWLTRESERTCPYCWGMHKNIFKVGDAKGMINNFYDKVKEQDVQGMKDAMPFLTTFEVDQMEDVSVAIVPAHPNCECRLVVYQ